MRKFSNAIGFSKLFENNNSNKDESDDDKDEEEDDFDKNKSHQNSSQLPNATPEKNVSTLRRISNAFGMGRLINAVSGSSNVNDTRVTPLPSKGENNTSNRDSFNITKQFIQAEEGRKFEEQSKKQKSSQILMSRLSSRATKINLNRNNNTSNTGESANVSVNSNTNTTNESQNVTNQSTSVEDQNKKVVFEKMKEHHSQDARRKASVMKVQQSSKELLQKRLTQINNRKTMVGGNGNLNPNIKVIPPIVSSPQKSSTDDGSSQSVRRSSKNSGSQVKGLGVVSEDVYHLSSSEGEEDV
jgi:hypothetical protein